MRKSKRDKLEKAGWKVGDTKDFLGLSDAEMAIIDVRVALATELKRQRLARKLSQARFATLIGSSQSRVAKMEAGDRSVSFELLVRALLVLGATTTDIGRVIKRAPSVVLT